MGYVKNGDCISLIDNIQDESVHLIVSDIPYGISLDDWDVYILTIIVLYLGTALLRMNMEVFLSDAENR